MRVFLTGAGGFIGSRLLPCLNGHRILALTRTPVKRRGDAPAEIEFLEGDLNRISTFWDAVIAFRPEACVHLAWEGLPDYSENMSSKNERNSLELLRRCLELPPCRRVVATGTCWEYARRTGPLREDGESKLDTPFEAAKTRIRSFGLESFPAAGKEFLWLRVFFAYGPGQRAGALIPSLLSSLRRNEEPALKSPEDSLDFIHVDDVATALAAALERGPSGTYNIGTGRSTRVREVAALAKAAYLDAEEMPHPPDFASAPDRGFWADITQTKSRLRWSPRRSLEESMRDLVRSWADHSPIP